MILNDNIKLIIYSYYTYTDKMIDEFRGEWQEKIKKVNLFFNQDIHNYRDFCYVCQSDHLNFECPKYYYHLHIINSLRND